jgi:hypothetical protein
MLLKGLIDEDVVNYRKTSMYLAFPHCSFKCGKSVCQNASLAATHSVEITPQEICDRYLHNPLTSAIVCGGLEPFDSRFDLIALVDCLRWKNKCNDDVVIYTGYTEEELTDSKNCEHFFLYQNLKKYPNVIIKFGRYVPGEEPHYDEILGVNLISQNQYAKLISE